MNGVHDMGGMHGMGPIEREEHEPVFHHEWERRAFALTMAAGFLGEWNIDMAKWLLGLESLLAERSLVTRDELASGRPRGRSSPGRVLKASDVGRVLLKGGPARLPERVPPRFKPGDRVVAKNVNPVGHTRLPRYARGKRGVVDRDYGVFIFPDAHAMGLGKKPQHLYSVRFAARELWGPDASSRDAVYVDLWDDHLDPA